MNKNQLLKRITDLKDKMKYVESFKHITINKAEPSLSFRFKPKYWDLVCTIRQTENKIGLFIIKRGHTAGGPQFNKHEYYLFNRFPTLFKIEEVLEHFVKQPADEFRESAVFIGI